MSPSLEISRRICTDFSRLQQITLDGNKMRLYSGMYEAPTLTPRKDLQENFYHPVRNGHMRPAPMRLVVAGYGKNLQCARHGG
ncbi:hypothetical protein, partial [uncultured Desulfovibrio sp.]|uniref:hypothetical protein n=1 Tax=uncultured Desulfovibrio sp. TaxID=167968 RepID=UPI002633E591